MSFDYGADIAIVNSRATQNKRPHSSTRGCYIDRRDNSLVFRTFSQEEVKLVTQIRTSDANRAAAERVLFFQDQRQNHVNETFKNTFKIHLKYMQNPDCMQWRL